MQRDPRASVLDMIQAAERAMEFVATLDRPGFLLDEKTRYAVWARIVITGEAVRRLPSECTGQYADVPWTAIAGMRHRLVHGYDVIDWEIVWTVVREELRKLLPMLRRSVPPSAE